MSRQGVSSFVAMYHSDIETWELTLHQLFVGNGEQLALSCAGRIELYELIAIADVKNHHGVTSKISSKLDATSTASRERDFAQDPVEEVFTGSIL